MPLKPANRDHERLRTQRMTLRRNSEKVLCSRPPISQEKHRKRAQSWLRDQSSLPKGWTHWGNFPLEMLNRISTLFSLAIRASQTKQAYWHTTAKRLTFWGHPILKEFMGRHSLQSASKQRGILTTFYPLAETGCSAIPPVSLVPGSSIHSNNFWSVESSVLWEFLPLNLQCTHILE